MTFLRRFAAPVAGLFLLAFFAGCDSGDSVSDLQSERTTVEFANPGAGAVPEDGEVSFDVVIRNPDGEPVSVEVLYAAQASTADLEAIGGSFGENNVFPVSFGPDAEDGDRETITLDVSNADITGGALEARFALQRLESSGRAEYGNNREFTLSIGPIPIAEALERGTGSVVTIQGTVTRAFGDYARIQDVSGDVGAAGMTIRQTFGDLEEQFSDDIDDGTIREGTELLVTGELSSFNGLFQINNTDLSQYTVLEQGQPVDPIPVTLQQASSGDFLSVLVRIEGLELTSPPNTFSSGTNYDVISTDPDDDTELVLRIQDGGESNVGGAPAPQGEFTFEGVMGVFGSPQVLPILRDDIITDEELGGDPDDDDAETVTIAEAIGTEGSGETVAVEGLVTRVFGETTVIEDGTAGIVVSRRSDVAGEAEVGAQLRVEGSVTEFNGLFQLDSGNVSDFEVLSFDNDLPDPAEIGLDEVGDFQSRLVTIGGLEIDGASGDTFEAGTNYDVTDGTTTITLRVDGASFYVGEPIPEGAFTFRGITGEFNGEQIFPLLEGDIEAEQAPQDLTIAEAIATEGSGDLIRVEGTVTRVFGTTTVIEDGTAGIVVSRRSDVAGEAEVGAQLRVEGSVTEFNGLFQLDSGNVSDFEVLSFDNDLPDPAEIGLDEVGDFQSRLVTIGGLEIDGASGDTFEAGTNYDVTDGTTTITLRVDGASFYVGEPIPEGAFTFRGITGEFNGEQIFPLLEGDIEAEQAPQDLTIAEAIATEGSGDLIRVEGTVTRVFGTTTVIQDATAGIVVSRRSDVADAAEEGDILEVVGSVSTFNGLFQLDQDNVEGFDILSSGNDLPAPAEIGLDEVSDFQSQLVRIDGLEIADDKGDDVFQGGGAAGNYDVTDGSVTITLRIDSNSFYAGEPIPEGTFTFEGITGEFNGEQIFPLNDGDIIED